MQPETNVLDRMMNAVERVRQRLIRAIAALDRTGVPYAVAGGNAVAAWVSTIDESAVRNTQDVDILLERSDLDRARLALESAGFTYRHAAGIDLFLDGPLGKARDAIHVIPAGEKVRADYAVPAPGIHEAVSLQGGIRVVALEALLRMKLTSFRRKDQVHILDMIEVGLVGPGDLGELVPPLAARLRELLENPDS